MNEKIRQNNYSGSIVEKALGTVISLVIYDEFKEEFREAEMRVRIRRHVKMAKAVKDEVDGFE